MYPAVLTIGHLMPRSEPIKSVRGVRDILPGELALWRNVEQAGRDVARRFGYEELVTTVLELSDLFERVESPAVV